MPERNTENSPQQAQALAAELKRVREAAKLSQAQMAARLGLDYAPEGRKVSTGRATVSAWERGRRAPGERFLKLYIELGGDSSILTQSVSSQARRTAADERPVDGDSDGGISAAGGAPPAAQPGSNGGSSPLDRDPSHSAHEGPSAPSSQGPAPVANRRLLIIAGAVVAVVAITIVIVIVSIKSPSDTVGAKISSHAATGSPSVSSGALRSTWTETTGTPAHTFSDATQLTGAGLPLGPRQSVQISCRTRGYVVEDGDPWWYRIESAPWNGRFYATSDAFYNNGAVTGPVDTGVVVDEQVPICK